ncbi:MAG: type II toxin-antitoxin system mRNA interferase toxin, RelE/StbE family [Patescibacteria group bacterium]|nr:type II toxin-antitoxin system mRNA interferase toxin, RelE/StbE family [Patescibacteria group bacterium]
MHEAHGVRVETTSHFERAFGRLPPEFRRNVVARVRMFENNPFSLFLKTHKLGGKLSGFWSFSVVQAYRILVSFPRDGVALLHDVGTHDLYR